MKTLILTLLVMIQVSLSAQTIPVSARFLREEYRLFIYGKNSAVGLHGSPTDRTDQIFSVKGTRDSVYTFQSLALRFVCDVKNNTADVYFDKQLDDTYVIRFWDCYNYFVVEFPKAHATYYFYRIYAPDKSW